MRWDNLIKERLQLSKRKPETTHAELLSEFIRDADAIQGYWQVQGPIVTEIGKSESDEAVMVRTLSKNLDNLASYLLKSPLNGRWVNIPMTPLVRMRESFNKSTVEEAKTIAVILLAKFREGDDREENAITMTRAIQEYERSEKAFSSAVAKGDLSEFPGKPTRLRHRGPKSVQEWVVKNPMAEVKKVTRPARAFPKRTPPSATSLRKRVRCDVCSIEHTDGRMVCKFENQGGSVCVGKCFPIETRIA